MCLICERINQIKHHSNPAFVKEMQTGYVVIGDHQHFYGYTLFLCKKHVTECFQLDKNERMTFLYEMSLAAQAVSQAFQAEKMNIEMLGNGVSHLHVHLFPRKSGDLEEYGDHGRGPVWWYPWKKMIHDDSCPSPAEMETMKEKLLHELNQLTNI